MARRQQPFFAWVILGIAAATLACGRSYRTEKPVAGAGAAAGSQASDAGSTAHAGAGAQAGGGANAGGRNSAGANTAGTDAAAGAPGEAGAGSECGLLIDDIESGTGRICEGIEGRSGAWYAFNDEGESSTQWPELTSAGVPIPSSEIPGGRGESRRAMYTYGTAFSEWGAGIGFDVAFDGETYGLYDASSYDGITFWARGDMADTLDFRVSTQVSTLSEYGGSCVLEPCYAALQTLHFADSWRKYWVPFERLWSPQGVVVDRSTITNVQFITRNTPFDFWVDDIAFFRGDPDCCPEACRNGATYANGISGAVKAALRYTSAQEFSCADACTVYVMNGLFIDDLAGIECSPQLHTLSTTGAGKLANLDRVRLLPDLVNLELTELGVSDLSALSELHELRRLYLAKNPIRDLAPLAGLERLEALNVSQAELVDLGQISGLDSLELLDVSQNEIAKLGPPFELPALREASFAGNALTDLSGLAGTPALTRLNIGGRDAFGNVVGGPVLVTLSSLPALPNLSELVADAGKLTDISALAGRTSLTFVDLRDNQIDSLESLTNMKLLWLWVGGNPIRHIGSLRDVFAPVGTATKRITLDLTNTGLTDLTELANAEGLVPEMLVYLSPRDVDCVAQADNVAKLRERRVYLDICY